MGCALRGAVDVGGKGGQGLGDRLALLLCPFERAQALPQAMVVA